MSTTKISVTIDDADLHWLRRRAKRLHGGNLSAVVGEAAGLVRKQEALRAFLEGENVPRLTSAELERMQAEWRGAGAARPRMPNPRMPKRKGRR
jgi:hypothetical protein